MGWDLALDLASSMSFANPFIPTPDPSWLSVAIVPFPVVFERGLRPRFLPGRPPNVELGQAGCAQTPCGCPHVWFFCLPCVWAVSIACSHATNFCFFFFFRLAGGSLVLLLKPHCPPFAGQISRTRAVQSSLSQLFFFVSASSIGFLRFTGPNCLFSRARGSFHCRRITCSLVPPLKPNPWRPQFSTTRLSILSGRRQGCGWAVFWGRSK